MNAQRVGLVAALVGLAATAVLGQTEHRSAYSYVRETSGDVTVISGLNGTVEARRNLPISPGDELRTDDPGRAEIALADGNVLHVGGGTAVQFVSLYAQQGSDDDVSALSLREGSILLSVVGSDEKAVPRIDTEDVTVYTNAGARGSRQRGSPPRHGGHGARGLGRSPHARRLLHRARRQLPARPRRGGAGDRPRQLLARPLRQLGGRPAPGHLRRAAQRVEPVRRRRLRRRRVVARRLRQLGLQLDLLELRLAAPGRGGLDALLQRILVLHAGRPDVVVARSVGLVPLPLRQLVLRLRLEQLVLVARLRLLARVGLLGLHALVRRLVPDGLVRAYNSPWWNNYYRNWSYPRNNLAFAIHGTYPTRRVDMRGWNFTGSNGFGATRGRVDVVAGSRVVDRLGGQMAISSRPIVLSTTRTGAGVRDALRDYVREAPAKSSARPAATPTGSSPCSPTTACFPARPSRRCAAGPSWPSADG